MREQVGEHGRYGLARNATGVTALIILEYYCDALSVNMLKALCLNHSGFVVEFTCFTRRWGTTGLHNTVVWEVRNS